MVEVKDPREPVALLLLNTGGPDSLEAVRPFLVNFFSDPMVISLPIGFGLQALVGRLIAWSRAKTSRGYYQAIGGRSPIGPLTEEQGRAVAEELARRSGGRFVPFNAFRYTRPFIHDALEAAKAQGIRRVVGLSMFPQYCRATTGSCLYVLRQLTGESPDVDVSFVDRFARNGGYLDALAECVREGLGTFDPDLRKDVHVVFSAHGVPQSLVAEGDPYQEEIEATVAGLRERLPEIGAFTLAYQSRATSAEWLRPYTDEVLGRLGAAKTRAVLVVPVSFVSDHVETLYEVDVYFAKLAREAGIATMRRSPSLNARPSFVRALADIVERHLAEVAAVRREVA